MVCKNGYLNDVFVLGANIIHILIYSGSLLALYWNFKAFLKGWVRMFLISYFVLMLVRLISQVAVMIFFNVKEDSNDSLPENEQNAYLLIRECLTLVQLLLASVIFDMTMFVMKRI